MKKLPLSAVCLLMSIGIFAQSVPQGIPFQAVARDLKGQPIPNKEIDIRISLLENADNSDLLFQEFHKVNSNKLGLFDLVIGKGRATISEFSEVPWSQKEVWIEIAIRENDNQDYQILSNSQLLSVPYALHAGSAGTVINSSETEETSFTGPFWKTNGNNASLPQFNFIGTVDAKDLNFRTANQNRLTIQANGDLGISKSLKIDGSLDVGVDANIGRDLSVGRNADIDNNLNVDGRTDLNNVLEVDGATDLNSSLTVDGATDLNSTLNVDGNTDLNSALNVNNGSPTDLSGTLNVDGRTDLNNVLEVDGATDLNSSLTVDGATDLKSTLNVDGNTDLKSTLNVDGNTDLNSALNVNNGSPTDLSGTLNVDGRTDLNNALEVDGATDLNSSLTVDGNTDLNTNLNVDGSATFNGTANLNGQVTINASLSGGDSNYDAYPLRVEGSGQGIAIKANAGVPSNSNNFLTFFNNGNSAIGRVEGETLPELLTNDEYVQELRAMELAITLAEIDVATGAVAIVIAAADLVAASTSSTACAGLGACVTAPVPSLIAAATANQVAVIADEVAIALGLDAAKDERDFFVANKTSNVGVTYQSGSADYAEWLPKNNSSEKFIPGHVVGLKNGKISLNTEGADKLFVISTKPIVLGNMPEEGRENEYEKVAFMGQVPVHVIGKVNAGDYILPSGNNNGFAKAISPANMKAADYANIVGMAWSSSTNDTYNQINVAIGLNAGDISKVVAEQSKEIEELKRMNNETNAILAKLLPGFKEALGMENTHVAESTPKIESNLDHEDMHFVTPDESNIVYFEITEQQIQEGIILARKRFVENGGDVNTHPFWKRMKSDPSYNEEVVKKFTAKMQNAIHTHQEINK